VTVKCEALVSAVPDHAARLPSWAFCCASPLSYLLSSRSLISCAACIAGRVLAFRSVSMSISSSCEFMFANSFVTQLFFVSWDQRGSIAAWKLCPTRRENVLLPEDKNLLFKEHVLEPRLLLDLQNGRAESFLVKKMGNL